MIYMEYENSGYVCLDGISKLFTDNGSHEHLFRYVASDISSLEALFEEYVSLCLDIKSFEVKAEKRDNLKKVLKRLKKDFTIIHPYYKYEFEKIRLCHNK